MISSKDASEQNEQETKNHEEHPDSLDMVLHLLVFCKDLPSLRVTVLSNTEQHHLDNSLKEEKQPEFAVVQLSHATADPEAMVVELADALAAFVAVTGSVWH